jgi:hypothetical protein
LRGFNEQNVWRSKQVSAGVVQKMLLQAFLISIFCCFFATSAGFGKWMRSTPYQTSPRPSPDRDQMAEGSLG